MPIVRSSLAKWSRQQLEDRFQDVADQNVALRKEINDIERKSRSIKMNGRPSEEPDWDKKCRKLENENQILSQKLKVMKHQLLTYTKAQVGFKRSVSRMSLNKERRQEIIEIPVKQTKIDLIHQLEPKRQKESRRNDSTDADVTIPINSLAHISSTSDIVRMHLHNQEMEVELDELRFNLESTNRKLTTLSREYDRLAGELETAHRNLHDAERRLTAAKSAAASRDASQDDAETSASRSLEIASKELSMLKEQNKLLKESQDRLIASALEQESSTKTMMQELSRFKSHVDSLEHSLAEESERRRKGDAQVGSLQLDLARWRRKYEKLAARVAVQTKSIESDEKHKNYDQVYSEDEEVVSDVELSTMRSSFKYPYRREMTKATSKSTEGIFDRLFSDVIGIVNSHIERDSVTASASDFELTADNRSSTAGRRTIEKWKKMYEEIYVELEKVRNLLITQYNINESLKKEIADLQNVTEYEKCQLNAIKKDCQDKVRKRDSQIEILENQLKSIAKGDKNALRSALSVVGQSDTVTNEIDIDPTVPLSCSATELTLRFTKLDLTVEGLRQAKSLKPTMFVSSEFFDFELETTPLLQGPEAVFDYSTVYNLVVSNLLVHYLETDGICVELFEVQGATYQQLGAATISLRSLLFSPPKSGARHISGQLKFYQSSTNSTDEGILLAILDYHVDAPFDLLKAFNAQKRKMTASLCLPVGNEVNDDANELCIDIHRCLGLGALIRRNFKIYAAYEIFDLPVHLSSTHAISAAGDVEIHDVKSWKVPNFSEALHKYLTTQELLIYLFDDEKPVASGICVRERSVKNASALGYVNLPLFPLAKNQKIRGTFPLVDMSGELMTDTSIELSIYWRFTYVPPEGEIVTIANRIANDDYKTNISSNPQDSRDVLLQKDNVEHNNEAIIHEVILPPSAQNSGDESNSESTTPEENMSMLQGTKNITFAKNVEFNPNIAHSFPSNSEPNLKSEKNSKSSTSTESIDGSTEQSNIIVKKSPRPESAASVASNATYSTTKRAPTEDDIILDDDSQSQKEATETALPHSDQVEEDLPKEAKDSFELDSQESSQLSIRSSSSSSASLIAPPSSSSASDVDTPPGGPPKPPLRRSLMSSTLNASRSVAEIANVAGQKSLKAVEFTEPLHSSIPPSESSSFAESLNESAASKSEVVRPTSSVSGKRSKSVNTIAQRSAAVGPPTLRNRTLSESQEDLAGIETEPRGAVVRIHIGRLRLVDSSSLLESRYDHAHVFVEWNFLDFSNERCETRHRLRLPRTTGEAADFSSEEQVYELNRKQIALLRQWTASNNKLMYTLVLDADGDSSGDASDDLCVGELPLADVVHKSNHFLTMRDVDNTLLATLEVIIQYSGSLRTYL